MVDQYHRDIAQINQHVEHGFVRGACHITGRILGLQPLDSDDLPGSTTYRDIPRLNATLPGFALRLWDLVTPVHYESVHLSGLTARLVEHEPLQQGEVLSAMTGRHERDLLIMAARHAIARVGSLNVNALDSRLTAFLADGAAIEFHTPDISVLVQCLSERGYHRQPDDPRGPLSCKLAGLAADRQLTDAEVRLQRHLRIAEGVGSIEL